MREAECDPLIYAVSGRGYYPSLALLALSEGVVRI